MIETIGVLEVIALFVSGIGTPLLVLMLTHHHQGRVRQFDSIISRLDHVDECIDALKVQVLGTSITRSEFDASILNMRGVISADTSGLHHRIMRLEDRALGK